MASSAKLTGGGSRRLPWPFPSRAAIGALRTRLARRGVFRPLDERLGRDELAVLVLRDEFEADAALPALGQ